MSNENRPKKTGKSEPNADGARPIVITVDDEHLAAIDRIARQLTRHGVRIDEVLTATGLICGTTACDLTKLKEVPGVSNVEEQTKFQVPPGDAPVH